MGCVTELPDLSLLSDAEKDALIRALWVQSRQVEALARRVAELEALLGLPPKTPDNSSLPPSRGQKANRAERPRREGPRAGSLGRTGGGRALAAEPDETVIARPSCCAKAKPKFTMPAMIMRSGITTSANSTADAPLSVRVSLSMRQRMRSPFPEVSVRHRRRCRSRVSLV